MTRKSIESKQEEKIEAIESLSECYNGNRTLHGATIVIKEALSKDYLVIIDGLFLLLRIIRKLI